MTSVSSIARSGMQAATQRLGASARNVAVSGVEGAKRQIVSQQTLPDGGVASEIVDAAEPGPDLAADLVEAQSSTYAFKANLKMVEVEHSMLGALLDEKV